jgi:hypothetical protein
MADSASCGYLLSGAVGIILLILLVLLLTGRLSARFSAE